MSIKIGYKNYKVQLEEKVYDDSRNECFGIINYDEETIKISTKFAQNLQNETLIHELVHAIGDKYQLDINKDEKIVDLLAAGIYELILDNTEQVKKFILGIEIMKEEEK